MSAAGRPFCINGHPARRAPDVTYGGLLPKHGYQRDHLCPLGLGCPDAIDNVRYQRCLWGDAVNLSCRYSMIIAANDMMKMLAVLITLLLPYLAYAGSTSLSVDIEVVHADSVPSAAQVAGFTTLALNSDWTQPMPTNWLGECPNGPDGSWPNNFFADDTGHTWWLNLWWSYNYQHCIIAQVQDPDYGGLVLDMPWTVDTAAASVGTEIETASADYNGQGQGTANSFPPGMYLEMVARNTPYTLRGNYFAFYTWGVGGIYDQHLAATEWDVAEVDSNHLELNDSNVHNWSAGSNVSAWILQPWNNLAAGTNLDFSKYNTYAMRITNDGTTESGCLYINNVFQRCQDLPGGMTDNEKTERLLILVANACDYWNQTTTPACPDGTRTHLYVKSVRVWSCVDWKTTQCSGKMLRGAP